jgi:flagellar capping protein FliD
MKFGPFPIYAPAPKSMAAAEITWIYFQLSPVMGWQVNALHSESVGLQSVHSMTGTVQCSGTGDDLSSNFLFSSQYYPGGTFDIQEYDSTGQVMDTYHIVSSGNTIDDLIPAIKTASGGSITASLTGDTNGALNISASDPTHTFAIKPNETGSSSNALAVLGVNTYFT